MRVEINNDRHRPAGPDPVASAFGVFGVCAADELSAPEQERCGRAVALHNPATDAADAARDTAPPDAPIWSIAGVAQRVTALYARLSPGTGAPGTGAPARVAPARSNQPSSTL